MAEFDGVLSPAKLIRRYKRFLADIEQPDGVQETIYCPNTGAMTHCAEPGDTIFFSISDQPKRKYKKTWELTCNAAGDYICIHAHRANAVVKEALSNGAIKELSNYSRMQAEVKYGTENSRIDFLLEDNSRRCFVEVKSCTLLLNDGIGAFPDAVSKRGQKHLRELSGIAQAGERAVLLFLVQHTGIKRLRIAKEIDPDYYRAFMAAQEAGVEVLVFSTQINEVAVTLDRRLEFVDI